MKQSYTFIVKLLTCMHFIQSLQGAPSTRPSFPAVAPIQGGTGVETKAAYPITNHGGPVLSSPRAYLIYYGNWGANSGINIINDFMTGLSPTAWWGINREYQVGGLGYNGSIIDNYSVGNRLNDGSIWTIVKNAVGTRLPYDASGIYLVLTSTDVYKDGFGTRYCGWHWYGTNSQGKKIIYGFVGNPGTSYAGCIPQYTSPNGNTGVDSMISVIAHELTEAATDPFLNAWYDAQGYENADKCAWQFGTTQTSNGAQYNMVIGARKFLVQQNWRRVSQNCGMTPA